MGSKTVKCELCGGEFSKYGISNHIKIVHLKTKNVSYKGGRKTPWNKGLTANIDSRIGHSNSTKQILREKALGRIHTDETKKKLSEYARQNELGGHTSKNKIKYKTKEGSIVYLQSSYEIELAKELDINNINWIRPKPIMWLDDMGVNHRYYPDFYLTDFDVYLDPKNDYLQKIDKRKIELVSKQNKVKILVLSNNELNWNILKGVITLL
jgi:hypothetical protein